MKRGAWARWRGLPRAARVLLALTVALLLLWAARVPLLMAVGEFLSVGDESVEGGADLIYVLGGDWLHRAPRAAELYREGVAPEILLIRVADEEGVQMGLVQNETDITIRLLLRLGVPGSAIRHHRAKPDGVSSTIEEALALRDLVRAEGHDRVVVVTSWYHTRRARGVLRRALRDVPVEVATVGAPHPDANPREWWRTEEGLILVVQEYLKFAHSWLYR